MPNKKISQLQPADPITGSELLALVQAGSTVKGTVQQLLTYIGNVIGLAQVAYTGDYNDLINKPTVLAPSLEDVLVTGNSTAGNNIVVTNGDSVLFENAAQTFGISLVGANATANHTITLPNATGTVALTSDLPATPTLSSVLAAGIESGPNDILMSATRTVKFFNATGTFQTSITNNQATSSNFNVNLPTVACKIAGHATSTPLVSKGIVYGTSNGLLVNEDTFKFDTTNKYITIGTDAGYETSTTGMGWVVNTPNVCALGFINQNTTNYQIFYLAESTKGGYNVIRHNSTFAGNYIFNSNIAKADSSYIRNNDNNAASFIVMKENAMYLSSTSNPTTQAVLALVKSGEIGGVYINRSSEIHSGMMNAYLTIGGSTTGYASLHLKTGVAPSSPDDGDVWFDGTGLKIRIGGVTRTVNVT
jgi:hypothetical protein